MAMWPTATGLKTAFRFAVLAFAALASGTAVAAPPDPEVCRGRVGDPIAACTRVITSTRSTREQVGDAYINRGQHHYEAKAYDRAIEDFNRAIPLKPKWLQMAYGNRGNAHYAKEEDDKAIDSYDKAIAIDPNYASALTARGLLYEKAGSIERARADYKAAIAAKSIFEDDQWAHDTARKHLVALADK
jgi:tetratricopeptide (TPR) repeat protein